MILPAEDEREYKEHSEVVVRLKERETQLKKDNLAAEIARKRMDDIVTILTTEGIDYTNPVIMKALIECIRVIDKHHIELQFKCGISIKAEL